MSTPEGRVKATLDKRLKAREPKGLWYFSPQAGMYGKAGVPDKIICAGGHFVAIECKADATKKPTLLQNTCAKKIRAAGGTVFVVCDKKTMDEALDYIDRWL